MAFQPIVDVHSGTPFAHEALVRGAGGEGAGAVLSQVSEESRYAFDQACRVKAIELAARLSIARQDAFLSINFLPNAVYEPRACIRATLGAAMSSGFPIDRIIFEFTEAEKLDVGHVLNILRAYRAMGFKTAIDDFGAGWSGLGLLSLFPPDIVKLDMELIRNIDQRLEARIIVRHTLAMIAELGAVAVCEGVETEAEFHVLCDLGVRYMQGYLLARPAFEALAPVQMPASSAPARMAG
jgi:EAL domain-containing protein (putative c-di-GMP-specific phosphodiesterase class I)